MAVGGAINTKHRGDVAADEAPNLPHVTWYKHSGLIKLYLVRLMLDNADLVASSHRSFLIRHHRI